MRRAPTASPGRINWARPTRVDVVAAVALHRISGSTPEEGTTAVARVAVDVVIKSEILDPQGKAILAALSRTGHPGVSAVRQGKHFDLEVDDSVSDEDLEQIASHLLANSVIEEWTVTRLGGK